MASRRIAKSAIDWVAFAERIPKNQVDAFRAFKAKSDTFVSRVHRQPESLPAIDWAFYKSKLAAPTMADQFEKAYQALTIPYPQDKSAMKTQIDTQEKEAAISTKEETVDIRKVIESAKALLGKIDSVPPPSEMTQEMYADYFPEQARNPWERPTFFPHTQSEQPGQDPHEIK